MPTESGRVGFVDYVLWGADGKPLGLVEAKRTKHSPEKGRQQAKLYADCAGGALRPAARHLPTPTATSTGSGTTSALPAASRSAASTSATSWSSLIQRRTSRQRLAAATKAEPRDRERPYQQRAIRAIAKVFRDRTAQRKALLVMATGSGKTRTVIALVDLLMRAGWVKRVLFLADRTALVKQAANAFKAQFLPDSAPVNLVTEKTADGPSVPFDLSRR